VCGRRDGCNDQGAIIAQRLSGSATYLGSNVLTVIALLALPIDLHAVVTSPFPTGFLFSAGEFHSPAIA
jgi:hypothetical protein